MRKVSLRLQLVAATLALAALALAATSVLGTGALRGYLVDRTDAQLRTLAAQTVERMRDRSPTGERDAVPEDGEGWLPSAYLVIVEDGARRRTLARSALVPRDAPPPKLPGDLGRSTGRPFTAASTAGDLRWRVLANPRPDAPGRVVVATTLADVEATIGHLQRIDLLLGLAALAGLAIAGVAVISASLRPLRAIERTAGAIMSGDLSRRVTHADSRTEVGRLGRALNGMLEQIEAAFRARVESEAKARRSEQRMRRFVADASHELRTPLTTIRGFAELHRQGATATPEDLDRRLRRIEDAAARMGVLVDDLLLLAQLDRQRPLDRTPVDLLALASDAVNDARVSDPQRPIELHVGRGPAPVVLGDEARLRQVLANLVTNALTHTPAGTPVELRLTTSADGGERAALLEVADHGPGFTPEQAERAFERFYRTDAAHSTAGTGLGLPIAAAIVAAHGGTLTLESEPGAGAVFRMRLSLADPDGTSG